MLNFNGTDLSNLLTVTDISGRGPFSQELNRFSIQGRPGSYLIDRRVSERVLTVNIEIVGNSLSEMRQKVNELNQILNVDLPSPIVFLDEPDKTFYGIPESQSDWNEYLFIGKGKITFICPDPFKYAVDEVTANFIDSGTVNISGTTASDPVIKVTVKQDTTFLAVGNGEKINMIGMPAEVTQQPIVREELKLNKDMGSLTGWADTTSVEEGIISGTMKNTVNYFYTDSYGTGAAWHGPAKKIGIGTSIQDFQVDALVYQAGASGQVGSLEIALLDATNNFVGKITLTKRSANSFANWVRMRAGKVSNGYNFMNTRGANDSTWGKFDGLLRISRVGNVWTAYACLVDINGVQHTRAVATWVDSTNIAASPISQIQVQLWQYSTTPTSTQFIKDLKVYQINSPSDTQIPIIAKAGDIVEFDHVNDIIRRNGEDLNKEKPFIGEYFPLKPGANGIVVEPVEAIESTEVRWRDRWL